MYNREVQASFKRILLSFDFSNAFDKMHDLCRFLKDLHIVHMYIQTIDSCFQE